jgi:hypothetical protein
VGVPGGVHAGELFGARQAPLLQVVSGALQSPGFAHDGKQKDPLAVLTHFAFAGQVV